MSQRRSVWRIWVAGVAALWLAVFVLAPQPAPPAPLARPMERWELPAPPARLNMSAAAATMATSPIWGARPPSGAAVPAEDTRWTFAGIFLRSGDPAQAVIRFAAARPTQTVTIGDELPDGSKVESIEPSRVCVRAGRKRECLAVPPARPPGF